MKLYHWTDKKNTASILKEGLRPNGTGIVYLTPKPEPVCGATYDDACLEVETGLIKLTAFDDCKDWEVLCWGHIPPKNIKLVEFKSIG